MNDLYAPQTFNLIVIIYFGQSQEDHNSKVRITTKLKVQQMLVDKDLLPHWLVPIFLGIIKITFCLLADDHNSIVSLSRPFWRRFQSTLLGSLLQPVILRKSIGSKELFELVVFCRVGFFHDSTTTNNQSTWGKSNNIFEEPIATCPSNYVEIANREFICRIHLSHSCYAHLEESL